MTPWSTGARSGRQPSSRHHRPGTAVTYADFRQGAFPWYSHARLLGSGLAEPSAQDSWPSPSIWPSSTLTGTCPYAVPPPALNMIVLTKYHTLYDFAAGLLSAVDTVWSRESNGETGLLRSRADR
jgi:hypothetical protein